MASEQLFYVGVKGLIRNAEGQYLTMLADVITHKKNIEPYWDIPGGRIKEGASIFDTLHREIAEETGITNVTNPKQLTTIISNHQIPYEEGKYAGLVLVVYTVDVPADCTVVLSDEHVEYAWVDATEAKQRLERKYPVEFLNLLDDVAKLA